MAQTYRLRIDGRRREVTAEPDEPLLYVLAELGLKGPRFGCGLAQCGACSVLVDGVEVRACVTPASALEGKAIATLDGLKGRHPVQEALIAEQAAQCGYCYNGMVIKAVELLRRTPDPSEAQIRAHMNGHLCRCGTYPRIVAAVRRAAAAMAGERA